MLILLLGPKGSGKTYIGRLLEMHFGIAFCAVEPLWMAYHAECAREGRTPDITEGIARVHPRISAALAEHAHVCVETTGASAEILAALLDLTPAEQRRIVRVRAPLERCLERIATRDAQQHIPVDLATIRRAHTLSESLSLATDLELDNHEASEGQLVRCIERAGILCTTLPRPDSS